jgi:2-polyprenyl-6-methoxyphenol hydroxylase-like FAD-dependent oxidoreductase
LQQREHAIVIGASMAGLLATRVLSSHFQRVTLLERDAFPPRGEHRRGVPQGRHTHGLLASGKQVLDRLFPGISAQLVEGGAIPGDIMRDLRWFFEGGCLKREASGLEGLLMSRPFLEGAIRGRVLGLANVKARPACEVDGLSAAAGNSRVTGVRVGGEKLGADLVVDTAGRGSKGSRWLAELGYAEPLEERVEIALAYTTRFFRRRPDHLNGDSGTIIAPTPLGKRGGVMIRQEGDRWTVTLIAHFVPCAPVELEGFIEYARNLPAPYIHEVVRDAEPLDEGASARFPASVRRRYERLDRFPSGFLLLGDAISSFNPIYGQGMSVAALEAEALDQTLKESPDPLYKAFFARASKVVDNPWSIAAGSDLRMPEAVGARNAGVNAVNWYMAKLHRAAHRDAVLSRAFHLVSNLLAPPPSVMHPRIAARVLAGNLR